MTADWVEQRVKMVDGQVRTTDVTDLALLTALLDTPREIFVPEPWRGLAYSEETIEIAPGQGGLAPRYLPRVSPLAKLVQLAAIGPGDAVLDVGCGTGYSSALFSRLARSVVAVESDAALAARAVSALSLLDCRNVSVVVGPLPEGSAEGAPYDVIFVGGAIEAPPDRLFTQLREGGRLVVGEGQGNAGRARLYVKSNGAISGRSAFNAALKPLPGFERGPAFQF